MFYWYQSVRRKDLLRSFLVAHRLQPSPVQLSLYHPQRPRPRTHVRCSIVAVHSPSSSSSLPRALEELKTIHSLTNSQYHPICTVRVGHHQLCQGPSPIDVAASGQSSSLGLLQELGKDSWTAWTTLQASGIKLFLGSLTGMLFFLVLRVIAGHDITIHLPITIVAPHTSCKTGRQE